MESGPARTSSDWICYYPYPGPAHEGRRMGWLTRASLLSNRSNKPPGQSNLWATSNMRYEMDSNLVERLDEETASIEIDDVVYDKNDLLLGRVTDIVEKDKMRYFFVEVWDL